MPTVIPSSQSATSRLLSAASPAEALRERAEAILWIRTQMARHGVGG